MQARRNRFVDERLLLGALAGGVLLALCQRRRERRVLFEALLRNLGVLGGARVCSWIAARTCASSNPWIVCTGAPAL